MAEEINLDHILMTNLMIVRGQRAWIDCEFALYQKLCRNREALLDYQLSQIKKAKNESRRVPAREVK
jgi:hypothetical protein